MSMEAVTGERLDMIVKVAGIVSPGNEATCRRQLSRSSRSETSETADDRNKGGRKKPCSPPVFFPFTTILFRSGDWGYAQKDYESEHGRKLCFFSDGGM